MFVKGDVKKELFYKGQTVFYEGDPGNTMYIMESGTVDIFKEVEGETIRLATLKKGELFGEMALIDGSDRMASAVAGEDSVLVVIPRELLESKMKRYDSFLKALLNILITNLRNVHRAYMKRPRSVHDYVNALDFHAGGFRNYLDSMEGDAASEETMKQVEAVDRAVKRLRTLFKDHQDRRRNVITDTDLS